LASFHSPPLYDSRCFMGFPTLAFTTVQEDSDITPVLKFATQRFVSV